MTQKADPERDWADQLVADLPTLATATEAVEVLRCSKRTLYRLVSAGHMHAIRHATGGSARLLIPRAELARYLRSLDLAA